ncbi:MAG: ABC transporter ATP-binding protein [Desulfobacteraceae bacterium]|nr:ABC transporter ATP-binding protein [Desulfobacteraceae bacterium]
MPGQATMPAPSALPADSVPEEGVYFQAVGLEKSFQEGASRLEVLQGVDLTIARGERIAIVGASGTGKTTLLHVLGTIDRPDGGAWLFRGEDIFRRSDAELSLFRNRTMGFVFQFHHLLPEFTALENVMMPGLIAGLEKNGLAEEAVVLLTKVGLAQRTTHRVGELSGGEQQRVALARAIIMKPALLLADEPTGNLDPKTGFRVFELIQELNAAYAISVIMVTHNPDLAARMDRCLTLAEGKLHPS